jgi:hypothetical protein
MGMIKDALGFSNIHAAKLSLELASPNAAAKNLKIISGHSICGYERHDRLLYFVEYIHAKNCKALIQNLATGIKGKMGTLT